MALKSILLLYLCRSQHGGIHSGFGFPVFTDPIEIHRYFEGVMDEMLKSFGMFGLNRPGIGWEDEGNPGDGSKYHYFPNGFQGIDSIILNTFLCLF